MVDIDGSMFVSYDEYNKVKAKLEQAEQKVRCLEEERDMLLKTEASNTRKLSLNYLEL